MIAAASNAVAAHSRRARWTQQQQDRGAAFRSRRPRPQPRSAALLPRRSQLASGAAALPPIVSAYWYWIRTLLVVLMLICSCVSLCFAFFSKRNEDEEASDKLYCHVTHVNVPTFKGLKTVAVKDE